MTKNPKNWDEHWMRVALAEARKGCGQTSPNPAVGAVLARGRRLLAKGYHRKAGLPHAEIEALRKTKQARGATLYVTLEPCCHLKKRTPPCTESVIASGVKRVVVGTLDPNPQVAGRGVRCLKKAGIAVTVGVLEWECRELNRFYNHWIVLKRPYVILKSAASLDGKIALANGASKWITSEKSRAEVHRLRSQVDAILVGIGTALADDPLLTARHGKNDRQPIRIVLDPELKIPLKSRLLADRKNPAWLICAQPAKSSKKAKALQAKGVKVTSLGTVRRRIPITAILRLLGSEQVTSLLVEGGPETWTEFLESRCFEEWRLFLAPKVLGGDARSLIVPLGRRAVPAEPSLHISESRAFGEDLMLRLVHRR